MSSSVLRSRALQLGHLLKFTHFKEPLQPLEKNPRTNPRGNERTDGRHGRNPPQPRTASRDEGENLAFSGGRETSKRGPAHERKTLSPNGTRHCDSSSELVLRASHVIAQVNSTDLSHGSFRSQSPAADHMNGAHSPPIG